MPDPTPEPDGPRFVSRHGHVLLALADNPDIRKRDLAGLLGLTERTVLHLVNDLEATGYITRTRVGRRNHYRLQRDKALPDPNLGHHNIAEALAVMAHDPDAAPDVPPLETALAPTPPRLAAIAIPVSDLAASTAYYQTLLDTQPTAASDGAVTFRAAPGLDLELHQTQDGHGEAEPVAVTLHVENQASLDAALRRVASYSHGPDTPKPNAGGGLVEDPDGHAITVTIAND